MLEQSSWEKRGKELSPRAGREACSQGAGGAAVTILPGQGLHAGTWAQQQKQPLAHGLGAGGGPELNPGPRDAGVGGTGRVLCGVCSKTAHSYLPSFC